MIRHLVTKDTNRKIRKTEFIYIREIGYLTDSKKVEITSIPLPTELIYGNNFSKNSKIGAPAASKIQAIYPAEIWCDSHIEI